MRMLLRPNGWVQLMEYYPNIQSWSGRLTEQSAITRWYQAYVHSMERANRNPRVGQRLQQFLTDAGFRDVGGTIFHIHIGGWDPGMLHHHARLLTHLPRAMCLAFRTTGGRT
jgi:hypothetical protein